LSAAAPDLVVTSNPGCILQIQSAAREQGLAFRILHIVELLDASISGRPAL
jgi:glycolate oxidase iron-sulfur subunit